MQFVFRACVGEYRSSLGNPELVKPTESEETDKAPGGSVRSTNFLWWKRRP
jgi:hypothetical protein